MNPAAYLQKHARRAWDDGPRTAASAAVSEAIRKLGPVVLERATPTPTIWDADWDICCVLDGCRVDVWQEIADRYDWLPASGSAWSVAAASPEWYAKTFGDVGVQESESVGIVTANPFAECPADRVDAYDYPPVHRVVDQCDYVHHDSDHTRVPGGTIPVTDPALVSNRAWELWHSHDLDRLVVHYMQPHAPFRAYPEWFDDPAGNDPWRRVRDGDLPRDECWHGYRENLAWALDNLRPLIEAVEGRFLLTSDHGNGMGEWGAWSHPPEVWTPQIRRVPWVRVDGGGTGEFEMLPTGAIMDQPARDRAVQLKALGYV